MSNTATINRLKNTVMVGEVLVLGWLLATEGLLSITVLLLSIVAAIAVGAIVTKDWPQDAVSTLVVASAMPRFSGTLFGLHVRPEHVAIGFVVLAICVQLLRGHIRAVLDWQIFDYFLVAYVGMNFLTSAVTSPEPRMTLRWAALNAIVVSPYFLFRLLVKDEARLNKAVHTVLWVGAAESAYGIVCFLSNRVFKTNFGVTAEQYGFMPGTYGTQYEANLFGSYTACCAIMFLAFYLLSQESRRARYGWGFLLTSLGALISLARSVLLALPVVALVVVWIGLKRGEVRIRKLLPLAVGVGLLLVAISPLALNFASERISRIDFTELSADDTTMTRLVQMAAAVEDVRLHPLLGTGTASFQLFFNWDDYLPGMGGDKEGGGWIGNSPLRILHDTGVVGLTICLMFLLSLALATRKALRLASSQTRTVLVALSAGLLLYAITFQATDATILAFTWVQLGFLAAAVNIIRARAFRFGAHW